MANPENGLELLGVMALLGALLLLALKFLRKERLPS